MKKIVIFILVNIFVLISIFNRNAAARDGIFELAPISITAKRISEDFLNTAQIFTGADLQRELKNGYSSLSRIADTMPFILASLSGGPGAVASTGIHGGSAGQTLLMIDGRPVNSPALGSFNLDLLPPEAFGRMEAFYGPVSHRFGINGLSGAINFTADALAEAENATIIRMAYASYGNFEQSLKSNFYNARNKNSHGIFLKRHIYGGYRTNSDFGAGYAGYAHKFYAGPKLDGYFSFFYAGTRNGAPGVRPAEGTAPEFGSGESFSISDRQADTLNFFNLDLKYSPDQKRSVSLKLFDDTQNNYFDTRYRDWFSGAVMLGVSEAKTRSRGIYLGYAHSLCDGGSFKAGANRVKNTLASRGDSYNALTSTPAAAVEHSPAGADKSFWANYRTGGANTFFEFGVNHAMPDFFKPANSYSAAAARKLSDKSGLKFFHAKGYRSPTLNDLYYPGAGNPSLRPEYGFFNSLALENASRKVKSSISVFSKKTSDMIEWFPDPNDPSGFRWTPQNINSLEAAGVSISAGVKISAKVQAGLSFETAKYRQTNIEEIFNDFAGNAEFSKIERDARQTPRNRASIRFYGKVSPRLSYNFLSAYTSKMKFYFADYSNAPVVGVKEKTIDSNVVSDLAFSYDFKKDERVDLVIENIFNKNYARHFGSSFNDRDFPMPGRKWKIAFNKFY